MESKTVSQSQSVISVVALPRDSNQYGYVFGGTVMDLVDQAAYATAIRHARQPVMTVCVDQFTFLCRVHIGDIITIKASVNHAGTTSMEVGVRVEAERLNTGEIEHIGSGYIVMVAIDENGHPAPVPGLTLESPEELRRHAAAEVRRVQRLRRAGRL